MASRISSRLPMVSLISILGYRLENAAIACGTKYFAVETAPRCTVPPVRPASRSSAPWQSMMAASTRSASVKTSLPASVSSMPSPVRCTSGRPARS
ncbi:hypothetical protein ABH979_002466 [Bradyrhizobium ottawaense]